MVSRIADPIEVKEMKAMRCAANLRERNRGLFVQWIYYCNCRSKRTILSKPHQLPVSQRNFLYFNFLEVLMIFYEMYFVFSVVHVSQFGDR